MQEPHRQTQAQRVAALKLANQTRTARARLKHAIREGQEHPDDVIHNPPEPARGMRVENLLLSIPYVGTHRTRRILRRAGVNPDRTLAGLTPRQREAITAELARRA